MTALASLIICLSTFSSATADERNVCAVASYTFSTGELLKNAGEYEADKKDWPEHIYLIETEDCAILMDRRDPLISSLLLKKDLWQWIGSKDGDSLTKGLLISDAPKSIQNILLDTFDREGFQREGLENKRVELRIKEQFQLTSGADTKTGSLIHTSGADIQPLKPQEERMTANRPPDRWSEVSDQIPLEFRIRFVKSPPSRTELGKNLEKVQTIVNREVLKLERESKSAERLGIQNIYKNLSRDLEPAWFMPDEMSMLDKNRRMAFLNYFGFGPGEAFDRWSKATISDYKVDLSFGLKPDENSTIAYSLPLWKK